jgi:hypothetical protein
LVVPERRDDLRDARRGALPSQCRDLLDGDVQIDSIGREFRRVIERPPNLDRLFSSQFAALE